MHPATGSQQLLCAMSFLLLLWGVEQDEVTQNSHSGRRIHQLLCAMLPLSPMVPVVLVTH